MNRKLIIVIACILASMTSFAQNEKQIDSMNYAHIKIPVPENCEAKSENEILDCDGFTIQWLNLNEELLNTVPNQFKERYANQNSVKEQTELKATSFGSELSGYKFKMKFTDGISYRLIFFGTVNNQPLLLNIETKKDVNKTADLNDFLKQLLELK